MISTNYYQSKEWLAKRKKFLKKKCAWCGRTERLALHHKKAIPSKYDIAKAIRKDGFNGNIENKISKRIEQEEKIYLNAGAKDLITLCGKCHYLWEMHGKRPCRKCKAKYVKWSEQKYCAECFIEKTSKTTKPKKKTRPRKVRKARKVRRKVRKLDLAIRRIGSPQIVKHMTVARSKIKQVEKELKKKRMKIVFKTAR